VTWSLAERAAAPARAEREGLDVLVVGGGITGAGVLRDAASRGLRALLVECRDFAAGTSSRSSKLVHGGLRYLAEGALGVVREACRERDLLMRQNPNLIRPLGFVLPAYEGGHLPLWQVRAALLAYTALANFRRTARARMLDPEAVARLSPDLRRDGLRGAGLYTDARVDDARLVLETLKSARALGAEAVNHAEVVEWLRLADGRIGGARVRDALGGRTWELRAHAVVNAAGPAVERLRGLDRRGTGEGLRPAKGVHLVIPRRRIRVEHAVAFEAADGRQLFVAPWDDVSLLGTTDAFTDEVDEPVVRIEEVHYLLSAANAAFPRAGLTTNDLRAVFAGVRPLAAPPDAETPASKVSREDRITADPSGLVSVTGGKLTTYRAMGRRVVDRLLARLPAERRAAAGPSRTAAIPLRADDFDRAELEGRLHVRFGVDPSRAAHLVTSWGADAEVLLAAAPPEWREPIGTSRFSYAEIPWSLRHECPAGLCDLLERRVRVALFADGQGLPELERIARVAAEAAGWDAQTADAEAAADAAAVRRRYQIVAPGMTPALAPAA
jgi:glycerol-3-phosphate dehydrogenase